MTTWKEGLWSGYSADAAEPAPAPTLTVPEGLPGEFADYLRGAIAYRQKQPEAARQAWQALLQRPAEQRRQRSTWAAYMLGRSYGDQNPTEALRWFQQTRDLAKEGYADSLGLASASLGWEAQIALKQGRYAPHWSCSGYNWKPATRPRRFPCCWPLATPSPTPNQTPAPNAPKTPPPAAS
jgi:hypothetical protein